MSPKFHWTAKLSKGRTMISALAWRATISQVPSVLPLSITTTALQRAKLAERALDVGRFVAREDQGGDATKEIPAHGAAVGCVASSRSNSSRYRRAIDA